MPMITVLRILPHSDVAAPVPSHERRIWVLCRKLCRISAIFDKVFDKVFDKGFLGAGSSCARCFSLTYAPLMPRLILSILSDIHYAGVAEQERGAFLLDAVSNPI